MPFFSAVSEKFSEQLSPKELHFKILQIYSYMKCANGEEGLYFMYKLY